LRFYIVVVIDAVMTVVQRWAGSFFIEGEKVIRGEIRKTTANEGFLT